MLAQLIPLPHSPWEFYGLLMMLLANLVGTYMNAYFSRNAIKNMNGKVDKLVTVSESAAFARGRLEGSEFERSSAERKAICLLSDEQKAILQAKKDACEY